LSRDKLARNEALFREVNERIWETDKRSPDPGQEPARYMQFLCECSDTECLEYIELTVEEYEEIREEPTHFALTAGHENGSVEKTAWETDRFVVVEKLVAEELLERTDPRTS
jgi:hypothetical protein